MLLFLLQTKYTCSICIGYINKPVKNNGCGHYFCRHCIVSAKNRALNPYKFNCPNCRTPWTNYNFRQDSHDAKKLCDYMQEHIIEFEKAEKKFNEIKNDINSFTKNDIQNDILFQLLVTTNWDVDKLKKNIFKYHGNISKYLGNASFFFSYHYSQEDNYCSTMYKPKTN